jgi:hypothetical protein
MAEWDTGLILYLIKERIQLLLDSQRAVSDTNKTRKIT